MVLYGILLTSEELEIINNYVMNNYEECRSWWDGDDLCRHLNFSEEGEITSTGDAHIWLTNFLESICPKFAVYQIIKYEESVTRGINPFEDTQNQLYYGIHMGRPYDLALQGFKKKLEITKEQKRSWKAVYEILKRFGIKNKRPKLYSERIHYF